MGHSLDPLLDEVKARYSEAVRDACSESFEAGAQYVEGLIRQFSKHMNRSHPPGMVDVNELLEYIASRPIL